MHKIKVYNRIAEEGLAILSGKFNVAEQIENPDGILLRSFDLHKEKIADSVLAIARAGAGTNNIPKEELTERGIVVFNTPGANANAVKELAIAALLLSSRNIVGGIEWVKGLKGEDIEVQVEKGKAGFTGPELYGKTLGVIGLGAIGVMTSNAALDLGMNVYGYDPYISVDAAWGLSRNVQKAENLSTIFTKADYISIHIPMTKVTEGLLNAAVFDQMKYGARIINFSRGELINNADMAAALNSGKVACYVTDFPNEETAKMKNVIAIPHLGASTPESEINCAIMAAKELSDYLLDGNIAKSVNFPTVELARSSENRLAFCHKNIPNMISQISGAVAAEGINIVNLINKSKELIAYTILDIDRTASEDSIRKMQAIEGMIKVRSL